MNYDNPNQPNYQNQDYGLPPVKQQSWLRRNGLWFFPLIIFVVGVPLVCCGGPLAGLFTLGNAVMKPRTAAIEHMERDTRVTDVLGTPLEPGSMYMPSQLQINNSTGSANIEFDVKGSRGTATVKGSMKMTAGEWSPVRLVVSCSDGQEIILPESAALEELLETEN